MSKLIFVVGFSGGGKTETVKAFSPPAIIIDGDDLFSKSLLSHRPTVAYEDRNDWCRWPTEERDLAQVGTAQERILESVPRQRSSDDRPIIADGAIFACDWFRNP